MRSLEGGRGVGFELTFLQFGCVIFGRGLDVSSLVYQLVTYL